MGNCCGIHRNFNIPLVDLLYHRARLKAEMENLSRNIEGSPEMRHLDMINQWLQRFQRIEIQIENLITDCAPYDNKCLINKKSDSLKENIASVDQQVLELLSQVPDFVLERPQLVPTDSTTGMESMMLDEVWSHVENQQDDHVGLIGLCGMGGVGKTALLKAVNNKLCKSPQNFNLQLWIDVSKSPNPVNIQNHIGEKIGFRGDDWKVKSQVEKATEIYNVLCQKKYILLLDDVWEQFDLTKIGIPLPNLTNKSIVIFTTRSLQVCRQMEAKEIQIQCLNDEEAWKLFQENVGEDALRAHANIPSLARDVMKRCGGLPLALTVIGQAMTLKTTIDDWKHAIHLLEGYAAEFSTITEEVFIPLKYSYDNLTNDAIRSCLLYCSLYVEDLEISKSDLVNKWISEGFLGRFQDLDKDKNEGYSNINTLVDASLLEKCSLEENIKMHGVIRNMALWIGGNRFYVKARAGVTQIPKDVKGRQFEKLSLMDTSIEELNSIERPRVTLAQQVQTDPTFGVQSMLDEVWSHVKNQQDDHVRLIGLYGIGSVGQTTLLKAVNKKLCSSTRNFDIQLFIVVSKTPNLGDIQNQIGAKIGFHDENWKTKGQREKATDIYNVLFNKKYILLLDDLWEPFNLKEIGIPHPEFQNMKEATDKSMVIFTTRSLDVCDQMIARPIKVQYLEEEEAWNLFKENVGERTLKADHHIPDLARVLMRECSGFPLALVVLGRAMSSKTTIHEWGYAIQVLKRYTSELSITVTDKVFILLKYSYDNLRNDAIRSCLLYCSLYAEDYEISKSDLVDKWICEGFLSTFDDLHDARNEGYSYINTLVRASLLEESSLKENVKMHDVIRDMALWIAEDYGFYVKARVDLTEVPKDVKWGHVEKLSLMDNSIKELNNGPTEITNLKTMLFFRAGIRSINNDFWKFFPNLKVLDLSHNERLSSLPKEFGDLVCLQYLNLYFTMLRELPNEIQKLVKLKYLNVDQTLIQTIPKRVLSSMKELSVFICGEKLSSVLNLVKEFEGLKNLQDVQIAATSKVEISNLTSSINLSNCITRFTMAFFRDSTSSLDILFLKEMKHLQILKIEHSDVERIVVGEGKGLETSMRNNRNGFNNLRSLHVHHCHQLTNLSWLVFLPNIEYLRVSGCDEMQRLVSENEYKLDNEVEPFAKLHTLELLDLPKLESIYFTSLSFPCLNRLLVNYGCKNLKKLPFNSSSCDQGRGITIHSPSNKWWKGLQWEDEATQTTFSSRFKSYDCKNLKRLPFNSSSCDQGRGITIEGEDDCRKGLHREDEATRTTFSSCFRPMLYV